jgi:hypothetical protein
MNFGGRLGELMAQYLVIVLFVYLYIFWNTVQILIADDKWEETHMRFSRGDKS